ncbi:hypothetical protein [Sodalis sp. (in: enterobacteria)]|uniref:hypothetical protein n=1 Tax=Sodalis sp. (in: enterobacteria) TaxID=1898979 RepID=UPI0039E535E5
MARQEVFNFVFVPVVKAIFNAPLLLAMTALEKPLYIGQHGMDVFTLTKNALEGLLFRFVDGFTQGFGDVVNAAALFGQQGNMLCFKRNRRWGAGYIAQGVVNRIGPCLFKTEAASNASD